MPNQVSHVLAFLVLSSTLIVLSALSIRLLRVFSYSRKMREFAGSLGFNYTQLVPFRPPVVNGFYHGREVVVDTIPKQNSGYKDDSTRVRVFHIGEIEEEFTVATEEYFNMLDVKNHIRPEVDNPRFEEKYQVKGGRMKDVDKFLDESIQEKMLAYETSLTVGRHEVSHILLGYEKDTDKLLRIIGFLAEAAAKADLLVPPESTDPLLPRRSSDEAAT